jgi:hypothetical protein
MKTVAGLRTAFLRLRVTLVVLPFLMPLTVVVCSALALRGTVQALYVLTVLGIVWLSTRCVKTWNEYRMAGTTAIGSVDMAMELAQTVAKHVNNGLDPDAAIEGSFGFGLGLAVGHFGWTPAQARDTAYTTAQAMQERVKGQE